MGEGWRGSQELLWGTGGVSARCAACLPEQMGAVEGERLGIAVPADSRSRLELPFSFTFLSLSCLKTWGRFNSHLSELPAAAAGQEPALEVARAGTSFSHYLGTFILPQ